MPIQRNALGEPIPRGKVIKELKETWIAGTMPSWLEASSGTASYGATATSSGYIQVTSGTANGNLAVLRTTGTYGPTHYREITWHLDGLRFDTADGSLIDVEIQIAGTNAGGQARTAYSETNSPTYLEARNASGNLRLDLDYDLVRTAGAYSRNVALMIRPDDREIYLLEDDQVMGYLDAGDSWAEGVALRPLIALTNRNAASHYFRIAQARLTLLAD